MKWEKSGLIFRPESRYDWTVSHATLPIALHLRGDIYRVYFSSRDSLNRSHVGYIEIDINQPDKMLYHTTKPVLAPGPIGYFDGYGAFASCTVTYDDKMYLYYIGWNPGKQQPLFYTSIGLAVSGDGGKTFRKTSKVPIMSISEHDPCLVTSPFVIKEGDTWRMWYVSGIRWEMVNEQLKSYYHIKYAESRDGVNWASKGIVCIDFKDNHETNIARPCIIKQNGLYKMWYSYSSGSYRIGYAESNDGITWERKDDEAGIDVSESGWDSEMIEYAFVFEHKGKKYMLYNGNSFGKDGFGLAIAV